MSKKDPTVREVYNTFSSLKKHALEVMLHYQMGINDVPDEDVRCAAKLISEMKEAGNSSIFFIGEALKKKGE